MEERKKSFTRWPKAARLRMIAKCLDQQEELLTHKGEPVDFSVYIDVLNQTADELDAEAKGA